MAKEYREEIWNRFKAATAVVNRSYQAYYVELKAKQEENLAAKTVLCEKAEAIAATEASGSNDWNKLSHEIELLQQ